MYFLLVVILNLFSFREILLESYLVSFKPFLSYILFVNIISIYHGILIYDIYYKYYILEFAK